MISINCLVFAFAIILLKWEYLSFVRARPLARLASYFEIYWIEIYRMNWLFTLKHINLEICQYLFTLNIFAHWRYFARNDQVNEEWSWLYFTWRYDFVFKWTNVFDCNWWNWQCIYYNMQLPIRKNSITHSPSQLPGSRFCLWLKRLQVTYMTFKASMSGVPSSAVPPSDSLRRINERDVFCTDSKWQVLVLSVLIVA